MINKAKVKLDQNKNWAYLLNWLFKQNLMRKKNKQIKQKLEALNTKC